MRATVLALATALLAAGCATTGTPVTAPEPKFPRGQVVPITNATFTPDAQGRLLPWSTSEHASANSYTMISDTAQFVSPPASVRIRRHGTEVFGMVDQRLRVQPEWAGKTMRLRGWLRSEGVSGTGGALVLAVRDGSDNVIRNDHMDDRRVKGNTNWAEHAAQVRLPPGAWWVQVGVLLEEGGTLWADDLVLEIVD